MSVSQYIVKARARGRCEEAEREEERTAQGNFFSIFTEDLYA